MKIKLFCEKEHVILRKRRMKMTQKMNIWYAPFSCVSIVLLMWPMPKMFFPSKFFQNARQNRPKIKMKNRGNLPNCTFSRVSLIRKSAKASVCGFSADINTPCSSSISSCKQHHLQIHFQNLDLLCFPNNTKMNFQNKCCTTHTCHHCGKCSKVSCEDCS